MIAEPATRTAAVDSFEDEAVSGEWIAEAALDPLRDYVDQLGRSHRRIYGFGGDEGPRLIIAEWEAEAYADLWIREFVELAARFGLEVGGNDVTDKALSNLRSLYLEEIRESYLVVDGADGE